MLCNYMSLHLQGQRLSKYFIRQFFILLKLNTRDNLPGEWGKDSEINKIVYTEPFLWTACRIRTHTALPHTGPGVTPTARMRGWTEP